MYDKAQGVLQQLGLDEKQQKIYFAALELGQASITELSVEAKLKRPTAYNAISELMMLGLIAQTKIGRRKVYSPVHPRRLLDIARLIERTTDDVLPDLIALYNEPKYKPRIQVFEGKEGVSLIYKEAYELLSNKEETLWFTRIDALKKYFPDAVTQYQQLLKKLKNPKIRELNSGNAAGRAWAEEVKELSGHSVSMRLIPEKFPFGTTDNMIFGNKVALFSLGKHVFVIVIESEEIANTFRALFNAAWEMAEVV
jgi:HTH-type transcriptional regulator, sugar sensing transcriptional regulator